MRQTAERIMDKTCGDQSGAWEHWAKDVINPRVDPRLALLRMVRQKQVPSWIKTVLLAE